VKENVEKVEAPAPKLGAAGRTRNRFNLRTQAAAQSTTEKAASSVGGDETESTTASRLTKPRPAFSLRGRGRTNGAPSTAAPAETSEDGEASANNEEKEATVPVVARPTTRLNLNRPGNRLLPGQKARPSPLIRSKATDDANNEAKIAAGTDGESDVETTTQNNLNKLKSRPRIQINTDAKASKKAATSQPAINRKVNPLISKRKFGAASTTGESSC